MVVVKELGHDADRLRSADIGGWPGDRPGGPGELARSSPVQAASAPTMPAIYRSISGIRDAHVGVTINIDQADVRMPSPEAR